MIVQITYNGTDYYIDSELILYGFDDTGLNLVLNQKAIRYNPAAEIFESNSLQAVTVPTYADFVIDTADDNFIEVTHATYTTVCINCARVLRLEDAGGGNTTIYFEIGATLEVTEAIATLQAAINASHGGGGGGGGSYTIITVNFASSPYTILPTTGMTLYQVDCTGGNVIINFPTAIGSTAIWGVKKIDSSANTITLEPFGAQTIDGNANQTILFQNTQVDIYSDNVNLFIK